MGRVHHDRDRPRAEGDPDLRDTLIATYGQQEEFQVRHDQLKHGVSLSQPFDDDGMAEYRLRLDPEGKEVLEAILGPLSAPRPTALCSDLRNSDQRRVDALIEVCRRAAAAGGAAPATTKAALFVTVDLADLVNRSGAGTSLLTGQLLAPETIRRIACEATIIPVVLGTSSEVLDVGRARRLFPRGSCEPCGYETRAAPSPAAARHPSGRTRTTSSTGPMAERPA